MEIIRKENEHKELLETLSIDCKKCSGLCCVALYFAKTDGFPNNKEAGKPCENLMQDFRCTIHAELADSKLKGCLAYDCFGAGQKVTQHIYEGKNWKTSPEHAKQVFRVFLIVGQLHQMCWYLLEASQLMATKKLSGEIDKLIAQNEHMTQNTPEQILDLNIDEYRERVNQVLKKASELVELSINGSCDDKKSKDFFGKNFRKTNLDGKDFSMAFLIAANLEGCSLRGTNFLGADLRDTNIRNTDLSESIFLTQGQVNSAKGNRGTKLPPKLTYPKMWDAN